MRRQNIDVVIGNLVEALLALNTQRVKALLLDLPSEGQALVSMEEVVVPAWRISDGLGRRTSVLVPGLHGRSDLRKNPGRDSTGGSLSP